MDKTRCKTCPDVILIAVSDALSVLVSVFGHNNDKRPNSATSPTWIVVFLFLIPILQISAKILLEKEQNEHKEYKTSLKLND